ncbi:MAG TPA: lactonase family protein [Mycoplana sp.]|nr:lactonase family protein [Mycoplana sp.]
MTTGSPFYFAYVGSRTTRERNARGDGINVYRVDAATGVWTHVQLVGGILNPSFLSLDRSGRFLYCVHGDASEISAFGIDPETGTLTFINQETTRGKNPVHLSFNTGNRFIVVANHITSSLAVLPRHEDGSLGKPVDLVVLEGEVGPHRVEQPFAKPHQVAFDPAGRFVAVPDKGLDRIFTFRLDEVTGRLLTVDAPPAPAREGAGPRHIAFHPSEAHAYVVNELDSTVTAYRFDPEHGSLTPLQVVSTLPDTFVGLSRAAEIAVSKDGRFLYASNRGHDSIAVYSIDPASGLLVNIGWADSRGRTPRFFTLDPSGAWLFVANEDSDNVVTFRVDQQTGVLSHEGEAVRTGSPVCIVFGAMA